MKRTFRNDLLEVFNDLREVCNDFREVCNNFRELCNDLLEVCNDLCEVCNDLLEVCMIYMKYMYVTIFVKHVTMTHIISILKVTYNISGEKYLAKQVFTPLKFTTSVGNSYKCVPTTPVDVGGIQTKIKSFQYLAFGNQTTFDPSKYFALLC